jgi:hypothetical protein
MDNYTIKKAYPWISDCFEIEISSENLLYTELGTTHSGCQSNSLENNNKIHECCKKVADLIREIEKLNTF